MDSTCLNIIRKAKKIRGPDLDLQMRDLNIVDSDLLEDHFKDIIRAQGREAARELSSKIVRTAYSLKRSLKAIIEEYGERGPDGLFILRMRYEAVGINRSIRNELGAAFAPLRDF